MAEAVAIAWRLCIINGDDIEGGPAEAADVDVDYEVRSYRQRSMLESRPQETWPELRERARKIALEYRLGKAGLL